MSLLIGIAGISDTDALSVSSAKTVSGLSRTAAIAMMPMATISTGGITNDQRQLSTEASAPDSAHAAKWPKMTVTASTNDARSRCAP